MIRSKKLKKPPFFVSLRSNSADSAGVSVTALNTDSATANAIVSENCW